MHNDIKKALEVLKNGGIILYPTDTIWGIGCDATNVEAVKRVYEIKQRKDSKSMLVLMENPNRISSYVDDVPEVALDLIEVTDKPTTIIYSGAKNLASNLINSDGSIGIRITNEAFTQQLIQRFKKPIVSTSANISGDAPAQNFMEISQDIIDAVDYVVEYRQEEMAKVEASSIIKIGSDWGVEIIRK
ncbi:L-threonylcarbamoyladenylate synthase [Ancylomarina sp. 16SWW S1-10-2]|uniref:L-threonylcarbamoyladenylate synthase n=1 Tax=Ancylomarina sp. 16SWW S1-10-2 TaxID=2499681 RepID=UPI0012AD88AC|nr:L-threonylcarbamoyladenylate synthase [Ancylomarina sp. 16SWW S1-10-2]MRT92108.1 threonylcarbamoyl-AMP synthase [Ancylomarina sp. 16SWW S1-10-2]